MTSHQNSTYLDINHMAQHSKRGTTALQQALNCMREPTTNTRSKSLRMHRGICGVALGVLVREGFPACHISHWWAEVWDKPGRRTLQSPPEQLAQSA